MSQPAILLTGASGVVGGALLEQLQDEPVICLTHRRLPERRVACEAGDLTQPRLGLTPVAYRDLAARVGVVIHCAAITDFTAGTTTTQDVNVKGTARILEFAAEAGAVLHYVSTAFVHRTQLTPAYAPEAIAKPDHYLMSKVAAERLVKQAELPGTVIRPSIVSGDARTGRIVRFQGLHSLVLALLRDSLPFLPITEQARIDWVPQDHLAAAIAGLVGCDVRHGEYWVTAGPHALSGRRLVALAQDVASKQGMVLRAPRFIDPEAVERLIRPAFIESMPRLIRRRFDEMTKLTALVATETEFPCSYDMPGRSPLDVPTLEAAWRATVAYVLQAKALAPTVVGAA